MRIKNLSIIVLNDRQDQLFEQALMSVAFAEQIIVVDQGSANDWQALEKKLRKLNPQLNFRLIFRKNPITDFAALRNKMIKKVSTPWLMFLDSDEILSQENLKQLAELLNDELVDAYLLKRIDYFHQRKLKFGETGNYYSPRLARVNAIKYDRQVHEVAQITGQVKKSNLIIKHFSHQNLANFLLSVDQYAQLEANYRFAQNIPYTKTKIILQAIFYPMGKFLLNYWLKLGFLDGFAGLCYAWLMSIHSLLVRIYLYEKYFLN